MDRASMVVIVTGIAYYVKHDAKACRGTHTTCLLHDRVSYDMTHVEPPAACRTCRIMGDMTYLT